MASRNREISNWIPRRFLRSYVSEQSCRAVFHKYYRDYKRVSGRRCYCRSCLRTQPSDRLLRYGITCPCPGRMDFPQASGRPNHPLWGRDCYFPVRADVRTVPWQSESVCIHFPHWRILGIYLCQNRASSLYHLPPHGSEFHGFHRKPVFPWRNLYPGGRFFCHERFSLSSGDADSTGYRHSLLDCCVRTCNLRYRSSCNKLEALPTDSCRALYSKRETVLRHFLKRRHDPLRSVLDHSDRFAAIYVMILAPVAVACATSTSYAAVRILPEAFLWYRNRVSIP